MLRYLLLLILAAFLTCSFVNAQPYHGAISGNWQGIIDIDGNCWVSQLQALTIEEGTVVRFLGPYEIRVYDWAVLDANGTEEDPVIFTRHPDYTGTWSGLLSWGETGGQPDHGASLELSHCDISYAGAIATSGFSAAVQSVEFSLAYVDTCYIHNITGIGVYCDISVPTTWQAGAQVVGSQIENCDIGVKYYYPGGIGFYGTSVVIRTRFNSCNIGIHVTDYDDLELSSQALLCNNIILNSNQYGIQLVSGKGRVHNNVIIGPGPAVTSSGIVLEDNVHDLSVINNIVLNNALYGIELIQGLTEVIDYNDVFNNTTDYSPNITPGGNAISQDPYFVGTSGGGDFDYHLLLHSPCVAIGEPNTYDPNPSCRSDMGAYGGPEGIPYYIVMSDPTWDVGWGPCQSPLFVYAPTEVEENTSLEIVNNDTTDCYMYFDQDAGITVKGTLQISGASSSSRVVLSRIDTVDSWEGIAAGIRIVSCVFMFFPSK